MSEFARKTAPNVVDKVVEFFSPSLGLDRRKARTQLAMVDSYSGASRKRPQTRGLKAAAGDADAALDYGNLEILRDRANHLERNDPAAAGAIDTTVVSVVGSGLSLSSSIKRDILGITEEAAIQLKREIEFEFSLWADSPDCDLTRTLNFYSMQELALRRVLVDGDSFVNLPRVAVGSTPYNLKLQLIDGARVATPGGFSDGRQSDSTYIFNGIEKDSSGAPSAYFILNEHPYGVRPADRTGFKRAPIYNEFGDRNILHLFNMLRPEQSRGHTFLAPVIELFHVASRGTEAELTAWVIQGLLSVFIRTENTLDPAGNTTAPKSDGITLEPGSVHYLNPGEQEPSFLNPTHPNSTYSQFIQEIHAQIGAPLGIPLEVLDKRFQSSYSAAKAALNEAWRFFKKRRYWLAMYFCQPVFEAWMTEAVARGRIKAPGFFRDPRIRKAYCSAEWIGDAMGMLNPLQEVNAAATAVDKGLITLQRQKLELNGSDFDDDQTQIKREQAFLREAGLKESAVPAADSAVTPDQQNKENSR